MEIGFLNYYHEYYVIMGGNPSERNSFIMKKRKQVRVKLAICGLTALIAKERK
jgi:hypothetical protein